jgi:CheY-like chemotaxis protein
MDGGMLCSQVRSDSKLAGTKIIVLSSSVGVSQNEFGNLDIAAFLYKPIKQSELFNAIANTVAAKITLPHSPLPEAESMPSLNVLLAEDGIANQKLAMGLLKRWGHTVTVVENGSEAVNTWANGRFDVILMDVQMPVMDGLEATQTIRSKEAGTSHHVPIIAVTAHAMTGDRDKCVAAMDTLPNPSRNKLFTRLSAPWSKNRKWNNESCSL